MKLQFVLLQIVIVASHSFTVRIWEKLDYIFFVAIYQLVEGTS